MKSGRIAMIARLLIVSLFFFSFQTATAGMIGTDRAAGAPSAQAERGYISSVLARAEVASQLEALGVDVNAAKERVALMTDEEARSLAGKLDQVPAGADAWGVVLVIAIVGALWWWWTRR